MATPTYDPAEISAAFVKLRDYAKFYDAYDKALPDEAYFLLAKPARLIGRWVIDTRAIPANKAKAIEMAVRAFRTRRPRDFSKWWTKNKKRVQVLLDTENWPAREEADEDEHLLEVGPFTIHNTLRLSGKRLERTVDVVERATAAVESSDRILHRVLYGPVYIVGRIQMPRTLAWYMAKDDLIYLRPMPKDSAREVFTLIHELGHRYWNLVSPADRSDWLTYDTTLRRMPIDVPTPKVGDVLTVDKGEQQRIVDVTFTRMGRGPQAILDKGGRVPFSSIMRVRELQAREVIFPSPYSLTDPEEHFSEAFAMHVLGQLDAPHDAVFDSWVKTSAERAPAAMNRALTGS